MDEREVWFDSADADLLPSAEAFAGLALVPAAYHRVPIRIDAPLSPVWIANVRRLLEIHREWWGTPSDVPLVVKESGADPSPSPRVASSFSGGVDSFHVALNPPAPLDALVFVHGVDMPIADAARAQAYEPVFRRVAERRGLRAIVMRTNARENPFFKSVPWSRTHGSLLAAVGHVLGGEFGRFVIPASSTLDDVGMWGSHWRTDCLWSSGRVGFIHHDPAVHRNEKVLQVAANPLLWDSLRVCWENRVPSGNCSACEKCVKTMALLEAAGQRANYTVFDRSVPLSRRVAALRCVPPHMTHVWANILKLDLPPDVKDEIRRVLKRKGWSTLAGDVRALIRRARYAGVGRAARRRWREG